MTFKLPFIRWSRAAVASIALFAAASPGWGGAALDRIKQTGTVTIAYRTASVPFSYTIEEGKPMGYSIDLCQRFVQAIGRATGAKKLEIKYVPVTSKTRIPAIVEGQADLECESTTNTAERRKLVAFAIPHYVTGARFAVRANSDIAALAVSRKHKLVSTTDTSPLKAVRAANSQYLIGAEIGEVPDHAMGLEWVDAGKADGFVMDEVLLAGLNALRPDPSRLKIVGKYLTIEALGIMLPRDDLELLKIVNEEMRRLIYSGEAATLHDHWFVEPIPPKNRSLGVPMPHLLRDFWRYPSERVPE